MTPYHTKSRFWVLLLFAALAHLSACGRDPKNHSRLAGVRDNASILLVENTFLAEEDEYPTIPGSTLYYILMSDPTNTHETKAYAIDCRGKNIAELAAAFGVDPSTPYPASDSYETIEQTYKISQQPIFRCSSVNPSANNAFIHKVFQIVDDRPDDKKKEKPLPQLFVRFNAVTADDAFNQEQFFSIGCRNILNAFGTAGQKSLAEAAPILASSAASIFPDFENYSPLNCTTNTLDPLLNQAPKKVEDLAIRAMDGVTQKNLEFYRVIDVLNPQKTISYLVGQGSDYSRVLCYNIADSEIKKALRFPSSYITQDVKSDDARYINARSRPELECVNLQTRDRFENRWSTVRTAPVVNYYKKKNTKTVYRFGCASAESYFTAGLNLAPNPLQVTPDLLDYLVAYPATGYKVVNFPCYGAGTDASALQMGEVVSLKMLSASADRAWLEGNTIYSDVTQVAQKYTGSFWLVHPASESGYFHLKSLGSSPGFSYLACPVQGNVPRLVKSPDENGYQTKWAAYRGDGASTVRLGCQNADGRIRFLNGSGATTTLSEEETGTDAATNWWIEHQTFVEDPSLLPAGQIVSIYSMLTPQDNRWLAAYPGQTYDAGLEANTTSPATRFQVEGRKDSRGVSLRSLNSGDGDRYLDCKPEADKRWFELAPAKDGIYTGTGYKAYRLTNSPYPIFKLACFNGDNAPFWMSLSGQFPWLRADSAINLSDESSILYPQTWPNNVAPGAQPRQEKIPRIDVSMNNKCPYDIEMAILSFDTAWTTKVVNVQSKKSYTFPVQNQLTYYTPSYGGGNSQVYLQYQGLWQQTFEFNHNYHKTADGGAAWTNALIFCP